MLKVLHATLLSLLVLTLATGQALAAVPGETTGGPPAKIYQLLMDDGYPVLADYELAGHSITPVLDTGTSLVISVSPDVYAKLPLELLVESEGTGEETKSSDGSLISLPKIVLTPMLGSGIKKWMLVDSLDMRDIGVADSILPLSLIDADYAAFLISHKELRLYNVKPSIYSQKSDGSGISIKYVPYLETLSGIYITISCQGQHYLALLDTGSVSTFFATGFCDKYSELFEQTDDVAVMPSFIGGQEYSIMNLRSGISILGQTQIDDIPLSGQILAETVMDFEGQPLASGELGLPDLLAYSRPDAPSPAPVAIIGMDVLGKYDFMIDRRFKLLYYWDPSETDAMFPKQAEREGTGPAAENKLKRNLNDGVPCSLAPGCMTLSSE
jgi:hypothetical protein